MKAKLLITSVTLIALLLFVGSDVTSKWRVKTEYHIHKIIVYGEEHIDDERRDTLHYSKEGKRDLGEKGESIITVGNTTFAITRDKTGNEISSSITFLNKQGLVDSVVFKQATRVTYAHKYFYDSKGNLIEDRNYPEQPPIIIFKYKLVEGNRIEERITNIPSIDTSLMTNSETGRLDTVITKYDNVILHHEYFKDKLNMPTTQNFGYINPDLHSKNLLKKSVQLSLKGDTLDIFLFHYKFDEKGRVISVAQISRSGTEYDSTAYSYY